jgi:hypothetical protein
MPAIAAVGVHELATRVDELVLRVGSNLTASESITLGEVPSSVELKNVGGELVVTHDALQVYPPAPLSLNGSGYATLADQAYGNGQYRVVCPLDMLGQEAFDQDASTAADFSAGGFASDGAYTGANGSFVYGVNGFFTAASVSCEWIALWLPSAITLRSYSIQCPSNAAAGPTQFILCGSNDGNGFTFMDQRSNVTWTAGQVQTFTPTAPATSYAQYRLLILRTSSAAAGVAELSFTALGALPANVTAGNVTATNLTAANSSITIAGNVLVTGDLDAGTTIAGLNNNDPVTGAVTLPNHTSLFWGSDAFTGESLDAFTTTQRTVPFAGDASLQVSTVTFGLGGLPAGSGSSNLHALALSNALPETTSNLTYNLTYFATGQPLQVFYQALGTPA